MTETGGLVLGPDGEDSIPMHLMAGERVTVPDGLPSYVGRAAEVLRVDDGHALIEWVEADGSRTATWEPFNRLRSGLRSES